MALPLSIPVAPGAIDPDAQPATSTPMEGPSDHEMEGYYRAYQKASGAGDQGNATLIHDYFIAPKEEERRQRDLENAGQDMRDPDPFMAGVGHGMQETEMSARDLGAKAGLLNAGDAPSPEEWKKFDADSADTMKAKDTGVGNFLGGAIALAPVGMGVEGALERAGGLLPQALRFLTGPTAKAIATGAAEGSIANGQDHEGGAKTGALTAGFLSRALAGLGVAARGQTPTDAARLLEGRGVRLTPGQRGGPTSWLNTGEQVAESFPFVGDSMRAQRGQGAHDFENAVIREGIAPDRVTRSTFSPGGQPTWTAVPGQPPNPNLPRAQQLQEVQQGFRAPYDQVGRARVLPEVNGVPNGPLPLTGWANGANQGGAFEQALQDPAIWPDAAARGEARAFLDNQLEKLPGRGAQRHPMDAARLMDLRSSVREQARQFERATDIDSRRRGQLLRNVEDTITESLREQLPPDLAALNNATDRQYAIHDTVGNAVSRAGDRPVTSPNDLSQAIASKVGRGPRYSRYTSDLRDLAQAGHEALDVTSRPTGQRILGAPAGAAALAANLPGISAIVRGQTRPQAGYRWLANHLQTLAGPGGQNQARRLFPQALGALGADAARRDPQDGE